MTRNSLAGILLMVLGVPSALALEPPRLSAGLQAKVAGGIGKMTEDEVLELVRLPVEVSLDAGLAESDYVLVFMEAARIRVDFTDGKADSATAAFSNAFESRTLNLKRYLKVKPGMTAREIEALFGLPGNGSEKNVNGRVTGSTTWQDGRELRVYVKDGRVSGCAYLAPAEK